MDKNNQASFNEVLLFVRHEVSQFIDAHPGEVFSGFAFDCNIWEGVELNLCLTTQGYLNELLHYYQTGARGDYYRTDEGILSLKYNSGDWKYQCFSSMNCVKDEDCSYFDTDDNQQKYQYWIHLLAQVMNEFLQTPEYAAIPKLLDFKVLVYDHDEEPESSEQRLIAFSDRPMFRLN
ncbi:DUF4303 domain-containing protein [Jinshanibacter sp. LJY008]|uniref:DUF4303 domain-containing protein n=1 Tax=Limnobaculum eriocheiris TaxID=2897391 RepID=A0A9X1MS53_9GAMM|nr:DUF4303 domain-containing protein [Limnobaculum eriocheiris]MCD1124546.1 DUF4303 domain-containing protein [Limnobaculum eriocheiris]